MNGYRAYLHFVGGAYETFVVEAASFGDAMIAAEFAAGGRTLKTVELTLTGLPVAGQAA